MAEDPESGGEKTERPTGRRLSQAREEGNVAKSTDLAQVTGITAAFIALHYVLPYLWQDMRSIVGGCLNFANLLEPLTIERLRYSFYGVLFLLLPKIFILFIVAAVFGAGCIAVQTKFLWSKKLLKPKFSHINPIAGIKRLFSIYNIMNVIKSLAKLAIIIPVAYFAFVDMFPQLIDLMDIPLIDVLPFTGTVIVYIFHRIIILLLVLAILDYIWQWWSTLRQLKMTKVEVKEEQKSVEGDEQTRMQIRQKALQRARQRMFQAVKTADVVITNPTHYAVALSYKFKKGSAPKVVAKGRDYMAERIKIIARENGVPVVERKALARALFASVEVDQFIPYELYAAVAEILAYVYRIKRKNPFREQVHA